METASFVRERMQPVASPSAWLRTHPSIGKTRAMPPPRGLDAEALDAFARKGIEGRRDGTQVGEGNAVKVRRIMQITRDLSSKPLDQVRILDLGCGDGVYAIEAGLSGAQVVALDARTERMAVGAACALRHGLTNITFLEGDVRRVRLATHGEFDVVYCLGLLYHLDIPDVLDLLENLYQVCAGFLVVDTWVTTAREPRAHRDARSYDGIRVREHEDDDPPAVRRGALLKSIDNSMSFHFTRPSLFRALHDVGFSSVFECVGPPEPGKPDNRLTLVAKKGDPVHVATYPWLDGLSEDEIRARIGRVRVGRDV